jgi:DNA polymerase, archaea type
MAIIENSYGEIRINEDEIDIYEIPIFSVGNGKIDIKVKEWSKVRVLILDIETTGLDPYNDEIKAIGLLYGVKGNRNVSMGSWTERKEKELLEKLVEVLESGKVDVLIGHNLVKFDLPFIMMRCALLGVRTKLRTGYTKKITSATMNGQAIEFEEVLHEGIQIIDTMQQICIWDKSANKLSGYGLKNAAIELGLREERRLELTINELRKCYEEGESKKVLEYLEEDLRDTELLTEFLVPVVYYQLTKVPRMTLQSIATSSPALKAQKIYESYYKKMEIADDKVKYEGALSVVYKTGLIEKVSKIDIGGMYPWIMMKYGICSRKDPEKKFLSWMEDVLEERMKLKEEAKKGDSEAGMKQNALKILLNGAYGFCGTGYYTYNDMEAAALITAYGRKILKEMMKLIEEDYGEIIEVDTDGVYFVHENPKKLVEKLIQCLPEGITLDLEFENVGMYSHGAKNYILVNEDGSVVTKGIYRKRNKCKLEKGFAIDYCRKYFTEGKEVADKYYEEVIESINERKIGIEELTFRQKIASNSKTLVELGFGVPGDVISYWYSEVIPKHKKTGKDLKKQFVQTQKEEYSIEHYEKMVSEIYETIVTEK